MKSTLFNLLADNHKPPRIKFWVVSMLTTLSLLFIATMSYGTWENSLNEVREELQSKVLPELTLPEQKIYQDQLDSCSNYAATPKKERTNDATRTFKQKLQDLINNIREQMVQDISNTKLRDLFIILNKLLSIQTQFKLEPLENLKNRTALYFKEFYGANFAGIEFMEKSGGIQLRQTAKVTLKNSEPPIKYYVKTPRGGFLSPTITSDSSAPRGVDPKELFVYRLFALIDLTPEVHFFFGEGGAKEFYIATKDAGFTEASSISLPFITYDNLKDSEATASSYKKIATLFLQWSKDPEKTWKNAEQLEWELGEIEHNIIKGLTTADILSRSFLLGDFTINSGNIGFILNETLDKFKVINFALPHGGIEYQDPNMLNGFLSGNGPHRYKTAVDNVNRYILHSREQTQRIKTAQKALAELSTMGLLNEEIIVTAQQDIIEKISECADFMNLPEAIDDLHNYVTAIKYNLHHFKKLLDLLYTDEYIHHVLEQTLAHNEKIKNNFVIIPPAAAIFTHREPLLLQNAFNNAFTNTGDNKIVALPCHINSNHWVSIVFIPRAEEVQVIYNDPLGEMMPSRLRDNLEDIARTLGLNLNIVDLRFSQQLNNIDCGPFTVDNIIRIVNNAENLNTRDRYSIIHTAGLQRGDATAIRRTHTESRHNITPIGPSTTSNSTTVPGAPYNENTLEQSASIKTICSYYSYDEK